MTVPKLRFTVRRLMLLVLWVALFSNKLDRQMGSVPGHPPMLPSPTVPACKLRWPPEDRLLADPPLPLMTIMTISQPTCA
jgi:hypothetical protein